jgi:hypothetical protein
VSTRIEGASPPIIRITARAIVAAGSAYFMLTVKEEDKQLWRYNLSARDESRVAYGRIITPDHMSALRNAAEICANGYPPGSIERGLLDAFAQDTL